MTAYAAILLGVILAALVGFALGFREPGPARAPLTHTEEDILVGVLDCGLTTLPELYVNCGEDKALVAQTARRLTERGLLEIRGGALRITGAGREALASISDPIREPCTCDLCMEGR